MLLPPPFIGFQSLSLALLCWLSFRLLSKHRVTPVPGKAIFLFRAFFPSWRFFDKLGDVPLLEYRWGSDGGELGSWTSATVKQPRQLSHLIFNAHGNLLLAEQSLLQQLLSDLSELQDVETPGPQPVSVEQLTSFSLVQNLVLHRVCSASLPTHPGASSLQYQFRLRTRFAGDESAEWEDVLMSPVESTSIDIEDRDPTF